MTHAAEVWSAYENRGIRRTLRRGARRLAFTLVELLVAIAILSLLAAILFPILAQARERARKTGCASNLRQIAVGMALYSQDYDGEMPSIWNGEWNARQGLQLNWAAAILPELKNRDVFRCPDDVVKDVASSYNANLWLHNRPMDFVREPARCVMLMDGYTAEGPEYCNTGQYYKDTDEYQFAVYGLNADYTIWNLASRATRSDKGLPRHQGSNNLAFVDGHVKGSRQLKPWGEPGAVQTLEAVVPFSEEISQSGGAWQNQ